MDSLFAQTLREQDAIFYATFPAAAASRIQEEAQRQLQLHYDYTDDVPPLEVAFPPSPVERPRHALHPAHPYHHFAARHVSPDQRPHAPPPPPPDQVRIHAMRLSPLPRNKHQPLEKKPPLACLFCRGRKIACGSPLPGSPDKTCNQCQRRSLQCEYPSESRRGMRKKKSVDVPDTDTPPKEAPATDPAPSAAA
ncbi:hypothetical protein HYPSUDRAFT_204200 [Hypholoma sublateritium FD-334 SS-4]|uniref:Zn(2)-C6 fungal-type domain-containing protein n=1 Tax=Hypholoma sublateritium (strain FD-334 SS-4) TaxID=945553 RepID=A0A0D2M9D3_HYPSF|nr:hypothetical protein HYPSUDRAFT_204200 [Hypholoma sublateritium FD-334 SS-4]